MKTKELIDELSKNNRILITSEEYIKVPITDYKVPTVGVDTKYLKLCEDCPQDVAKLLFEYYLTPLEEREEEKKYCLRVPFRDYAYLNFYKGSYVFAGKIQEAGYQTKFTQKEIDAMPFDTSFFVKEETK